MRLAHLLVLHGPHLDLLGSGPLAGQPSLEQVNRAIELAASTGVAGVRAAEGNSEAELVAALHRNRDWATHVLISPGALAPTAYVLREALALAKLPYAEVHVDPLPFAADHAKKSVLREHAELQKRGAAPAVYVDAAEKLLRAKFTRVPLALPAPAPARALPEAMKPLPRATPAPLAPAPQVANRVQKEIGRKPRNEHVASGGHASAKTIGRAGAKAVEPAPRASGITRAAVRQQIAQRLAGKISPAELATWAREQWLAVERGAATESGQRELLGEALQALALSAAPGLAISEPELLDWMAKMG